MPRGRTPPRRTYHEAGNDVQITDGPCVMSRRARATRRSVATNPFCADDGAAPWRQGARRWRGFRPPGVGASTPSDRERCEKCHDTGIWEFEPGESTQCSCRIDELRRRRDRRMRRGIPERFHGVAWERPPVMQFAPATLAGLRRYLRTLDEESNTGEKRGESLWLTGPIGTGKSSAAGVAGRADEPGRSRRCAGPRLRPVDRSRPAVRARGARRARSGVCLVSEQKCGTSVIRGLATAGPLIRRGEPLSKIGRGQPPLGAGCS